MNTRTAWLFLFLTTGVGVVEGFPFAYVASQTANTISKIDLATNTVVATISLASTTYTQPYQVAATPDAKFLYIAMVGGNAVKMRLSDNALTQIPLPGITPQSVAITPDGTTAYFPDAGATGRVYPVDVATNTVGAFFSPGGSHFVDIAITPSGTKAYLANATSGALRLNIFDIPSNTGAGVIGIGTFVPLSVAVDPTGTYGYTSGAGHFRQFLVATDTISSGTVPIGGGPQDLVINHAGTRAYSMNHSAGTVGTITIPANATGTILLPGGQPNFGAITQDDSLLYVTIQSPGPGANVVYPITIANDANIVGSAIPVGATPTGIAIPPFVSPPENLSGEQIVNRFLFVAELFNELRWNASLSLDTVVYHIYRDGVLIATVPATETPLMYEDHDRTRGVSYTYTVTAVNAQGIESDPETITIP